MAEELRERISDALGKFSGAESLVDASVKLLDTLGYESDRTIEIGSVQDFLKRFALDILTEKQHDLYKKWKTVKILFQFTDDEVSKKIHLSPSTGFDRGD